MKKKLSAKTLFIIAGVTAFLEVTKILSGFVVSLVCLVSLIGGFFAIKKPWGKKVGIGLIIILAIILILVAVLPAINILNL